MKLSTAMITLVICGVLMALFGTFLVRSNETYHINSFSSAKFTAIQSQVNETNKLTEQMQSKVLNITQQTGTLDIVGFYFSGAYDSMRIGGKSVGLFSALTWTLLNGTGIPAIVIAGIIAIIVISFVIGFIIEKVIFKV